VTELHAQAIGLSKLLAGIDAGEIVLPEFQRDFDWTEPNTRSLLATVLSSWPAGSLLLMKGPPKFFAVREFEDAPTAGEDIKFIVLDGQQRLTALYHALRKRGPRVFALAIGELDSIESPSVDSLEESILATQRDRWDAEYDHAAQWRDQLIPLYALSSPSDFFSWRDRVVATVPAQERTGASDRLALVYKRLLNRVHDYSIPAVVLEHDLPTEAIARIFERINRTGLRLSTFDLMVARAYHRNWNLRDKWDEARREFPVLDRFFEDDGMPVLQAIALRIKNDVRQPAVLNLEPRVVQDNWDNAVAAVAHATALVARVGGVADPSWLPYQAMELPISALALDFDMAGAEGLVEPWFWVTAAGQRYDAASSTRLAEDYRVLVDASWEGLPGAVDSPFSDASTLERLTRRQSGSMWRTMLCALGASEPLDLLTGQALVESLSQGDEEVPSLAEGVKIMSLFGRGESSTTGLHLRTFGTVLALPATGRKLRSEGPGALVTAEGALRAKSKPALRTQLFPATRRYVELVDWPEDLIEARVEMFQKFITAKTGRTFPVEVAK
jgi:hypothetical protein